MKQLRFKKLHPDVIIPTRANPIDVGLDLYALEDVVIPPTMTGLEGRVMGNMECGFLPYLPTEIGKAKIKTGLAVEIPQGYYGKVSSRSGLAFKHGIFSFDGTIDAGYRGEIGILLYNTKDKPYQVRKGDKVAQLIILPCALLEPVEADELSDSDRGEKGFGSSGK